MYLRGRTKPAGVSSWYAICESMSALRGVVERNKLCTRPRRGYRPRKATSKNRCLLIGPDLPRISKQCTRESWSQPVSFPLVPAAVAVIHRTTAATDVFIAGSKVLRAGWIGPTDIRCKQGGGAGPAHWSQTWPIRLLLLSSFIDQGCTLEFILTLKIFNLLTSVVS